ncbi:MAG: hypothetical protein CSB48_12925 [Proteobacteria bacterium]|nr:MAG: hypothetical protein CSB48_12925 [Pseudomonadota bacterium]PIE40322.1 MAG: hypothetical protein CSA51_01425 [Gammaproteobacteria bacterium]
MYEFDRSANKQRIEKLPLMEFHSKHHQKVFWLREIPQISMMNKMYYQIRYCLNTGQNADYIQAYLKHGTVDHSRVFSFFFYRGMIFPGHLNRVFFSVHTIAALIWLF